MTVKDFLQRHRSLLFWAAIVPLYVFYVYGISNNPPGFYLDESGIAYNAYLIAHTGAGEFGVRWPLFFQFYTGPFIQYGNPTQIYLLAIPYFLFPPSILLARLYCAAWVFAASMLLGLLAARISGQRAIGIIVALNALLTPWLFEVGRLVLDVFFYPMALVLFFFALYRAHKKKRWTLLDITLLALTLALLTYTFTTGRLLAPLLALGLLFFAINKQRLIAIVKTWVAYAVTLIPLLVFNLRHPGALSQRFYLISYIKPQSTWSDIALQFVKRFTEEFSLGSLLLNGDVNPRHHVAGSLGSVFVATFILAGMGFTLVVIRHWGDPWWHFMLYGLFASVVPGALTGDQFHTLRLIAFPVFLLVMNIPALAWLLNADMREQEPVESKRVKKVKRRQAQRESSGRDLSPSVRRIILYVLLALTVVQGAYFQLRFHRDGPKRGLAFDTGYRELYTAAMVDPSRPIYLKDGYWGPAYIHAYWYATLERRSTSEFIHLPYGVLPPPGGLVLSSEAKCTNCQIIMQRAPYTLYRAF